MDMIEIDNFEKALQEAFPGSDLHCIIDTDGRAEVWSGEIALGVKWASADPTQLVGLPDSVDARKLTADILYDMVKQEVTKALSRLKEMENGS
jgi:hypothetical protein